MFAAALAAANVGIPGLRPEPPRRLRVTGEGLRPGARLLLGMPTGAGPGSHPVRVLEFGLYPTGRMARGRRIWESVEELPALLQYALLSGGVHAPDVQAVLDRTVTSPALAPTLWNRYAVQVINEDGRASPLTWQRLRVTDAR